MTIKEIIEIKNNKLPETVPVKEVMDKYIPGIDIETIPKRNGGIWVVAGAGGSGKTSMMLNFFKNNKLYRGKFDNIYYICPEASMLSVENHPFEGHDKVFTELTLEVLEGIYQELNAIKETTINNRKKKLLKNKNKEPTFDSYDDVPQNDDDEDDDIKYNCVFIDDMADSYKDDKTTKVLSKMLIKARHLCTMFIFTLQSYLYFPKILRKQITNITIFQPNNIEEWNSLAGELINLKGDDSIKLHNFVFDKEHTHLDIDTKTNTYYKNFNKLEFKK